MLFDLAQVWILLPAKVGNKLVRNDRFRLNVYMSIYFWKIKIIFLSDYACLLLPTFFMGFLIEVLTVGFLSLGQLHLIFLLILNENFLDVLFMIEVSNDLTSLPVVPFFNHLCRSV